jgi:hypothetical protein
MDEKKEKEIIGYFTDASAQNKQTELRYAAAYYNRGIAYYFKREYEKSWKDVEEAQSLAYQINPKFLDELRKVSGRKN